MEQFRTLICASLASVPMLAPLSAGAGTLTTLHVFTGGANDGTNPIGPLVYLNGMLYGTTYANSAVFSVNADTGAETLLYHFTGGADGATPISGLIAQNGILYGTAAGGGAAGVGVAFSIDPATGVYKILHDFDFRRDGKPKPRDARYPGALTYVNGHLYGATQQDVPYSGTVFRINPAMGFEKVVYDFPDNYYTPVGNLVEHGGLLYGMTYYYTGTGYASGPIYSVDPHTGTKTELYDFPMDPNLFTFGGLLYHEGNFYGYEEPNYPAGNRVIFQVNAKTGAETTLHTFPTGAFARYPNNTGPLIYYHGDLYGTADGGGKADKGFAFKINLATGEAKVIYNFTGVADGGVPNTGLTEYGGVLYGTTFGSSDTGQCDGSPTTCGTVFKITP